jgi:hypothetical protein
MNFVYKWTNLVNDKWYIGSHDGDENDGYVGSGKAFRVALAKHGKENFVREILYRGDDARQFEGRLLLELDAMHDPMSYNLINDGIGSSGRNNPAFGRRGPKHPMFGKHHSEKSLEKMRAAQVKHPKRGTNNPMYGRAGEKSPTYGLHYNSKLTQAKADEIRVRLKQKGVKLKDLAIEFGVSRFTIARIRDGVIYK